jgi:hypothetical protein
MQQSRRCWPIGQPEKTTRVEAFAYPIPHPGATTMTNPVYELGSDLRIAWEPVTHQSPKSAMQADTQVGRLTATRTVLRSRDFIGCINGKEVVYANTIEMTMTMISRIARERHAANA